MSTEDKKNQSAAKPAKKKKKNVFVRFASGNAKWFREMKSELKKVVWPTPKQITNNTTVALVVIIMSAILVWGFDSIASMGVQALVSISG